MLPIRGYVIISDSREIDFFEDDIKKVKDDLEYLAVHRPRHVRAVYKLVNVSLELEKEGI